MILRFEGEFPNQAIVDNHYGAMPFDDNNHTQLNEEYFEHIDYIVDSANDHGMYIALVPIWGSVMDKIFDTDNPRNAKRYGRSLGLRYADRDNVVWVVSGEYHKIAWKDNKNDNNKIDEKQFNLINQLAEGLKEGQNGKSLMTIHPGAPFSSSDHFHYEPWLDFNMIQTYAISTKTKNLVFDDSAFLPRKPTLLAEPGYEGRPAKEQPYRPPYTTFKARYDAYHGVFQGGFGHTYGADPLWRFESGEWEKYLNRPGSRQMMHLRSLMESRPMRGRSPGQQMIHSKTAGWVELKMSRATLHSNGAYAMIYFPADSIGHTINVWEISGRTANAWWYNCRDGKVYDANNNETNQPFYTYACDDRQTADFQPPSDSGPGHDWVLVLDDASRGYAIPGRKGDSPANRPPYVNITSPSSGTVFRPNRPITITATASDRDGSVRLVEFFHGSTLIGDDSRAPYSATWNGAPVGSHTLRAIAVDNDGESTSASVNISVGSEPLPPNGAFKQSDTADGLLSMEAENFHNRTERRGKKWLSKAISGVSGRRAMEAVEDTGVMINTDYAANSPGLMFNAHFVKTGTHYIWVRMFGPDSKGDSVHVGLDGRSISTADRIGMVPTQQWKWTKATMDGRDATFNVGSPGNHTVNLWMREDGVIIDKVVITSRASYRPSGSGPAQSHQTSQPQLQSPYPGPDAHSVPGKIEAEHFDKGGEGRGYHEKNNNTNPKIDFRSSENNKVWLEDCSEGGHHTGIDVKGEWLAYTADITPFSTYDIELQVATARAGAYCHIEVDGRDVSGRITVPNTGGWQNWTKVEVSGVKLPVGKHEIRVVSQGRAFNLNYLYFYTAPDAQNAFQQNASASGLISLEAENFHYKTSQSGKTWSRIPRSGASGARAMEAGPDKGTSINTGYAAKSPSLVFSVNFVKTGTHYVWVRMFSPDDRGDSVHVGFDGAQIPTADRISMIPVKRWKWTRSIMDDRIATLNVRTAEKHEIHLWMREDGVNVDKVVLTTNRSYVPSGAGPAESKRSQ